MALTFTLTGGTSGDLDLKQYLRLQPDGGVDPNDVDFSEPQFSRSPIREGGEFVLDNVGPREQAWAMALNADSKADLLTLVGNINRKIAEDGVRVKWQDVGASNPTYFDVVRGRLEPEFNYWRGAANWLNAVLRLWTSPYGHTATERIIGTAAGSGFLLTLDVPSAIQGDVDAEIHAKVRVGTWSRDGHLVAVAALPHASYQVRTPAASMNSAIGVLSGASGAPGSQVLSFPSMMAFGNSVPANEAQLAAFTLAIPSVYGEQSHRLLLAAKTSERDPNSGGVALRTYAHTGEPLGPTVVATNTEGWALVDLGSFRVPRGVASFGFDVRGGHLGGQYEAHVNASAIFRIADAYTLPEPDTALVKDGWTPDIAADDFRAHPDRSGSHLNGYTDDLGNTYSAGAGSAALQYSGVGARALPATYSTECANVVGATVAALRQRLHMWVAASGGTASTMIGGGKQIGSTDLSAVLKVAPSPHLGLVGSFAGGFYATTPIASLTRGIEYVLDFTQDSGRMFATLERADGVSLNLVSGAARRASVGASGVIGKLPGHPVLRARMASLPADPVIGITRHEAGLPVGTTTGQFLSRNVYNLTASNAYRANASDAYLANVEGTARGVTPKLSPSTPKVAVLVQPLDTGVGNDLLDVDVRVRERFTFSAG